VDRQRGKPFGGVVVQPWLGRTSPFCLQYDSLNLVDMYGIRVGNEASVDSPDILQESGIRNQGIYLCTESARNNTLTN